MRRFILFCVLGVASIAVAETKDVDPWERLNSPDPTVRSEARLRIEARPMQQWLDRALLEHRSWAALEAIRAVCNRLPQERAGELRPHLCEQLMTLPLEQMSPEQQGAAIEVTRLIFKRLAPPDDDQCNQMRDLWNGIKKHRDLTAQVREQIGQLLDFIAGLEKDRKFSR